MNKSKISGWKDVFTFTFVQTIKAKSFRVSFAIFLIISMISMPLVNLILSKDEVDENAVNEVKKVYVMNETEFSDINFDRAANDATMSHIEFAPLEGSKEDALKTIDETENTSVVLDITSDMSGYNIELTKASKGPVTKHDVNKLADLIQECFEDSRIDNLGITQDQLTMLHAEVTSTVTKVDTEGQVIVKEDTTISNSEYWFIYGLFFIVMMTIMLSGSQVATSIVMDKQSKVIEVLLTSVKPLAIIVGKVFAMLSAALIQLLALILGLFGSNLISTKVMGQDSFIEKYLPENITSSLNLGNILICLLLVIFGIIFYATLAGLFGSMASKIEEMSESMSMFTLISMIGAYVGLGSAIVLMASGMNGFVKFAFLFPISSPFILPGAILIGKVSLGFAAIAIVLQILLVFLLFQFVAKVYETLILHNGNKISVKDLIKISKTA